MSNSSLSNHAIKDDYDSSLAAEFLPMQGLPFTLRSSSLGFDDKNKISTRQNNMNLNAIGKSSLSVPLNEPKSTRAHRVRFLTETASEDNLIPRKVKSFGGVQRDWMAGRTNRRAILSNIPSEASYSDIFSLVWGGEVESVKHIPQSSNASVLFTTSEGCASYLNATQGGIQSSLNDGDRVILFKIETSSDPEMVTSDYCGSSHSRCVQITGPTTSWKDAEEMETLANKQGCAFEYLTLKKNCRFTSLEIRFLSIREAQSFCSAFAKEERWSNFDFDYCADPCASATGIHSTL